MMMKQQCQDNDNGEEGPTSIKTKNYEPSSEEGLQNKDEDADLLDNITQSDPS